MSAEITLFMSTVTVLLLCALAPLAYVLMQPNVFAIALVETPNDGEPVWIARLERATKQFLIAATLYAPLTIAIQLADMSNEQTLLGAQVFFVARLVHIASALQCTAIPKMGASFSSYMGILIMAAGLIQALLVPSPSF